MDAIGPKLTKVLHQAWLSPFSTKSNYARHEADWIAVAASQGLLTTRASKDLYGQLWRVTPRGLARLFEEMK